MKKEEIMQSAIIALLSVTSVVALIGAIITQRECYTLRKELSYMQSRVDSCSDMTPIRNHVVKPELNIECLGMLIPE